MTQVKLLTIIDKCLSLPYFLVYEYTLVAITKIELLSIGLILGLLEEYFLD